jgi:transposase InsO family protein
METVIGLFKTECLRTTVFHHGPYKTIADVECAAMGWVNRYNTWRPHTSIGFATPLATTPGTMSRSPSRSGSPTSSPATSQHPP